MFSFSTWLKQVRVYAGRTFWKLLCIVIYQHCVVVLNASTIYWSRRSFQTLEKAVESDPAKMMQNDTDSNT